jgi:hypothetical protein
VSRPVNSLQRNGGDDETRTGDLCRDSAVGLDSYNDFADMRGLPNTAQVMPIIAFCGLSCGLKKSKPFRAGHIQSFRADPFLPMRMRPGSGIFWPSWRGRSMSVSRGGSAPQ